MNIAISQPSDLLSPPTDLLSPPTDLLSPPTDLLSPPSNFVNPPSDSGNTPQLSLGPSVGGTLGVTEVLTAALGPGQVTTATTATAALDNNTAFPFHITFNNAALNVAQCASPVAAVPFVTTTVSTAQGVVQTTAYGDQFTF
ncbi:MspA family porin [Nocardia aurantiaca]|uniref:MspA family porin n=1 Tax=Nocardia aurantiaca TaxID=2675850 RepID=UPI001E39BDE8|nr:MspA family porin [Nocardia aurantiaca]